MTYNADDINNLALVAWKEARGEGVQGCRAVMHVICNRVGHPGFAHTLHDCIYGKNQFTSMSVASDPEYNLEPRSKDAVFPSCVGLSEKVLQGSNPDLTNGAHYYANLRTMDVGGWFQRVISGTDGKGTPDHALVATIGHHSFYF